MVIKQKILIYVPGITIMIGLIAFFNTNNDIIRNYFKLSILTILYALWYYYNLISKKILLSESEIKVGRKVISITEITSIKIYEDFIRLGGNYRTDPQTWKKYVQIRFHSNNSKGEQITKRIDELADIEEQFEKWALGNNIKYTRIPRGQAY